MSRARSERPRKVVQVLPASSSWISTGRDSNFCLSQARASSQVLVKATRWAPCSSLVRARSSFSSATARLGFRGADIGLRKQGGVLQGEERNGPVNTGDL